jgi:hypothetical protein
LPQLRRAHIQRLYRLRGRAERLGDRGAGHDLDRGLSLAA